MVGITNGSLRVARPVPMARTAPVVKPNVLGVMPTGVRAPLLAPTVLPGKPVLRKKVRRSRVPYSKGAVLMAQGMMRNG